MIRFAADENFNNDIIRGLLRRNPSIDIVRLQEAGLSGSSDPEVLEWAAGEGRVLLTHDVATMPVHAYNRVRSSLPMAGVVEVAPSLSVGQVIEDIALLAEFSLDGEWENRILYLPLR